MNTMPLLALALLVATPLSVGSYFLLARLTKLEHDSFHDEWLRDGNPHGLPFWVPVKELHAPGRPSHPGRVGRRWLVRTPAWALNSVSGMRMLTQYRVVTWFLYAVLALGGLAALLALGSG